MIKRVYEGAVVTLTLDRPEKRNALNAELVTALKDALAEISADDAVRVVVLTGAGTVFSAGADLAALQALHEADPLDNLVDSEHLAGLFAQIHRYSKPVIAKINGHAVGGGCGLAAVCDFSIASTEAKLGFTEVRLGFVPAIVSVFVLRKLGGAVARDLFMRGRLVSAEEAAAIGLITRTAPPEQLDEEVHALAREITTETSGTALRLTKRLLADVPGMGLDEALAYAARLNAFARSTADCRAGVQAFLDKTDPPWRQDR